MARFAKRWLTCGKSWAAARTFWPNTRPDTALCEQPTHRPSPQPHHQPVCYHHLHLHYHCSYPLPGPTLHHAWAPHPHFHHLTLPPPCTMCTPTPPAPGDLSRTMPALCGEGERVTYSSCVESPPVQWMLLYKLMYS